MRYARFDRYPVSRSHARMVTLSGKSPMKKLIEFFIYYLLHLPPWTAFFAGRMLPPGILSSTFHLIDTHVRLR